MECTICSALGLEGNELGTQLLNLLIIRPITHDHQWQCDTFFDCAFTNLVVLCSATSLRYPLGGVLSDNFVQIPWS
ncbi:hypothetical protein MSAN_02370800 [Mycena sanguinolenta]|uniref:Uncharacterized protein n=1 Tax=Mycena sanguinolenta TaxID=230812 RepID=A0A8H7CF08_9AGAR|nr:hypothetical protein MSAN_02370800 [Mycena sanguinolenta]